MKTFCCVMCVIYFRYTRGRQPTDDDGVLDLHAINKKKERDFYSSPLDYFVIIAVVVFLVDRSWLWEKRVPTFARFFSTLLAKVYDEDYDDDDDDDGSNNTAPISRWDLIGLTATQLPLCMDLEAKPAGKIVTWKRGGGDRRRNHPKACVSQLISRVRGSIEAGGFLVRS